MVQFLFCFISHNVIIIIDGRVIINSNSYVVIIVIDGRVNVCFISHNVINFIDSRVLIHIFYLNDLKNLVLFY